MGEEFTCSGIDLGPGVVTRRCGSGARCRRRCGSGERLQHLGDVLGRGGLVAGDRHVVGVDPPDVDTAALGLGLHRGRPVGHSHQHGVEERVVHHLDSGGGQPGGQRAGVAVHPAGDRRQPVGAVVAGIHRRQHRQQYLGGADVGSGLVAADVLFAGLQRQPVSGRPVGIHGHPDQSAGQLAGVLGVHRQVAGVRAAESHWHTEALGGAERDVGTQLAGRGDQRQRQQVGAQRDQGPALVGLLDELRPVRHPPAGAGQLRDDPEEVTLGQPVAQVGGDDLDAERLGAGGQDRGRLGEQVGVDGQPVGGALRRPRGTKHQRHRLGGGGALVQHRGVGHLEAGQVGDHGLEVQQRLEPALADLRLVRGVGGVPGRVLHDAAQQHRRGQRVVIPLADHGHRDGVGVGQRSQLGQRLMLRDRRRQPVQAGCDAVGSGRVEDARGQGPGGQLVQGGHADHAEHRRQGVGVGSDMAIDKGEFTVGHRGPPDSGRTQPSAVPSPSVVWPERFGGEPPFPVGG